ncbi:unnamed protein product, partial [Vitis vinifera]|uniref:Uncharacterized protein n=1 Tax=Vitis vinifera TaxID=29760 RepID=D7SKN9_VITVI
MFIFISQITGWWPCLGLDQGEGEKKGREMNLFGHIPCMSGNLLPWSHLRTKQSYHEAGAGS